MEKLEGGRLVQTHVSFTNFEFHLLTELVVQSVILMLPAQILNFMTALFLIVPAYGHLNRSFPVARQLQADGYTVVYGHFGIAGASTANKTAGIWPTLDANSTVWCRP